MINLKKAINFVLEGERLKDKFFLMIYLMLSPLKLGLLSNVKVKNKMGRFFLPKGFDSPWVVSQEGEKEIIPFFEIPKNGTFIDVGANIGKYSIYLGIKNPSANILAIEPEKNNFEILKNNIKINELNNVILTNVAASDSNGKVSLYINKKNTGGHSLIKKSSQKIIVEERTIDSIFREFNLKKIDLIKIDVEGAEKKVLEGALLVLKKFHPKIIFESWNADYLKKVEDILKPLKYNINKIAPENYIAH